MNSSRRKVRYAVVGLGWFAQAAILPAFANARDNSDLIGLVTGDAEKARELGKRYDVPVVGYDDYEDFLAAGNVDAVYVVTPNSEHRGHAEKAARAGVQVLCEKPMAPRAADCQAMIDACGSAGVRLMIAYRLHFEEGNLETIRLLRSGKIGDAHLFNSVFTQDVKEGNFRLDAGLGGGPMEDVGVYCVNAARYLFRSEPTEVSAFAAGDDDARFREVPRAVSVQMRFPGGRLANFLCGFGEAKVSTYQVVGTLGDVIMKDAYTWHGDITQVVTVDGKSETATFAKRDQIAPEILYFSDCVLKGREPEPSGLEGLIDVRIIEAIRESYDNGGGPVKLEKMPVKKRPSLAQQIDRPANAEQELVKVSPPSS